MAVEVKSAEFATALLRDWLRKGHLKSIFEPDMARPTKQWREYLDENAGITEEQHQESAAYSRGQAALDLRPELSRLLLPAGRAMLRVGLRASMRVPNCLQLLVVDETLPFFGLSSAEIFPK